MNTLFVNTKSRGQKILFALALLFAAALLMLVLLIGTMQVQKYIEYVPRYQASNNLGIQKNSDTDIELVASTIFTGKNPCEGLSEKDCITQMKSLYYFIPNKKIILPKTQSNPENILFAQGAVFFWEHISPGVKDHTKAPEFTTYQITCEISKKTCAVETIQLNYLMYRTGFVEDSEDVPGRYAIFNKGSQDYKIAEDSVDKLVARMDYTLECGRIEMEVSKKDNKIFVRNYSTCPALDNSRLEIDPKEFSTEEIQ